jgi:hypothetical protein
LPALAAPPTFEATCKFPTFVEFISTFTPQRYHLANALYRDCDDRGGTATREIIPDPGSPFD